MAERIVVAAEDLGVPCEPVDALDRLSVAGDGSRPEGGQARYDPGWEAI